LIDRRPTLPCVGEATKQGIDALKGKLN